MSLARLLAASARAVPDSPAIVLGEDVVCDYATLARWVASRAGDLVERCGVRPGDRVALYATNGPEYLELLFSIWWAGGVAVPLNAKLHPGEIAALVDDSQARVCLVSPDLAGGLEPKLKAGTVLRCVDAADLAAVRAAVGTAPAPARQEDPAWFFYTSGTTGRPKGAVLSHGNLLAMSLAYLADVEPVDERSGLLHLGLMSHAGGLFSLPFVARGARQVLPPSGGADVIEVAHLLGVHDRLTTFVPPVLLRRLCASPALREAPVERMATVLVGAAPVFAADLRTAMQVFGPRVWNGYGQGESPCTITAMDQRRMWRCKNDDDALSSVGVPRLATEVEVVGEDGAPLPIGEVGEVVVSGPTVMQGYHGLPEATAQTVRGGWLHTGDLGRFDDRGLLTLLDRSKDVVISGGVNIYPREVEDVLITSDDVAEVAVVGVPDEEWGERVVAFVVPAPGRELEVARLDTLCLTRMARFKRPRDYHIVEHLPRNGAGKVLKTELRSSIVAAPTEGPR